jgi:hypothetical protein
VLDTQRDEEYFGTERLGKRQAAELLGMNGGCMAVRDIRMSNNRGA